MHFLFAWRYFKAKKSTNAINIIAWVSVAAIVVITAAFIILLSVFNGFEGLVKSLYSSFYADMRVIPAEGKKMTVSTAQAAKLTRVPGIHAYSYFIEDKALLQNGEVQAIVYLKGVDSNYARVSGVTEKVVRGNFNTGTADKPGIVLGSGVENALGLYSEQNVFPITAYLFKPGVNVNVIDPLQALSAENLFTAGTFFIQQDIDNKYSITSIDFMRTMLGMGTHEVGGIEFSLQNPNNENEVKRNLQEIFGEGYLVETRYEQNKSLYSVMTVEKWAIYGILTLMLIVAAFTMIGALSMLVLEKKQDIEILKALGAGRNKIQQIFLSEGLLLGIIGAGTGTLLGLLIVWAQEKFHLVPIQGGTFLISYYPVKLVASDFLLVLSTVLAIALIASWLPARKAGRQL